MSTPAQRAFLAGLTLAAVTAAAVVVPLWALLDGLFPAFNLAGHSLWVAAPIGLVTTAIILTVPATAWAATVATLADVEHLPVIRTTVRTAVPLALIVLVAVDLSQLFIDPVHELHRLGVHVLFTTAFAIGQATFHGVVATRIGRIVADLHDPGRGEASVGLAPRVALAAAAGVVCGSIVALALGWRVRPAMGWDMLKPIYLVMATGSFAAGATLGRYLVSPTVHRSRPPVTA